MVSAGRASYKRQKLQLNFTINVMIEAEEYQEKRFFLLRQFPQWTQLRYSSADSNHEGILLSVVLILCHTLANISNSTVNSMSALLLQTFNLFTAICICTHINTDKVVLCPVTNHYNSFVLALKGCCNRKKQSQRRYQM